jgi:hypothetical protein
MLAFGASPLDSCRPGRAGVRLCLPFGARRESGDQSDKCSLYGTPARKGCEKRLRSTASPIGLPAAHAHPERGKGAAERNGCAGPSDRGRASRARGKRRPTAEGERVPKRVRTAPENYRSRATGLAPSPPSPHPGGPDAGCAFGDRDCPDRPPHDRPGHLAHQPGAPRPGPLPAEGA